MMTIYTDEKNGKTAKYDAAKRMWKVYDNESGKMEYMDLELANCKKYIENKFDEFGE